MNYGTFRKAGFTLIELLIVIALIAVLTSIVVSSLSTSRQKGIRASVQANLTNARAQAELFFLTNQTYVGVCGTIPVGTIQPIGEFVGKAATAVQAGTVATTPGTAQAVGQAICWESANAWVASVPIATGEYYCVDSANAGRTVTATISANTFVCP